MSQARPTALALLLLITSSVFTFLLHAQTLGFGFDYDDYHFVRPYGRADLSAAFHGPWDSAGIERPYYRPLTIAFFATRFEVLGINATAHHALSLGLFAIAAALAGWLAFRLSASPLIGFLTTVFYVAHPSMPYSLVAWVTNQMHLIESIVIAIALIWWDAVRARHVLWWLPLLGFAVVAFLIKEDGLMLLPCIVVAHALRRRVAEERIAPVPRTFLAASAVSMVLLIGVRGWALADVTPARRPSIDAALTNYLHGLDGLMRLVPADRQWQLAASWFATLTPLVAVVCWRRLSAGARVMLVCGLSIAVLFNLPFVLITKAEQMHVVALGIVLLLAGASGGLLQAVRGRIRQVLIGVVCAAGLACFSLVTRDIARDFEPFGPVVLAHDEMVRGWAAVPQDLREYVTRKRSPSASTLLSPDPSIALDRVTFGTHGSERSPDGIAYRWMSGPRTEMLIRDGTRKLTIPLRHAFEVFREPARVRITTDGRVVDEMVLNTPEWRVSTTSIISDRTPALMRMHRVVITIDHAWRPMQVVPGSRDDRTLGLQIGDVQLR